MKATLKTFLFLTAFTILLGLPPWLVMNPAPGGPPGSENLAEDAEDPIDSLDELVARRSKLEGVFQDWQESYQASGGDRRVTVGLGSARGLTTEATSVRGRVDLDMLSGSLTARLEGLYDDETLDLWLVDNQDGPGHSVLPEHGDHMARLGRFSVREGVATLASDLGPEFFDGFELDLIVASRPGATPETSRVLVGTRPVFERLYTRARLEAKQAIARQDVLRPASLLGSLFGPPVAEANSTQILISHGLVGQMVGDGADLFFRGLFDGNGRTCGTCHPVEKNQEIGPDFIATLPADDPLFVAEFPKNKGGVPGLERPALMRGFGLILENVDGAEDPTVKFTMRGVPHSLSLITSLLSPDPPGVEPVERTGWSGDGAPGNGALRMFPAGAVFQHFTKDLRRRSGQDFTPPTDAELDDMEAFMLAVGRLNELDLPNVSLTDSNADTGRLLFLDGNVGKCNNCHFNAGANIAPGPNLNFNTGVEDRTHPARAVEDFPLDGGLGRTPADCDGDGVNDCFGDRTFNTAPLVEAADTGPFFHNNVIDTLEGAVRFYTTAEFTNSPSGQFLGPIVLSNQQVADITAFLRVINAGFNLDISAQRNTAAITLENSSPLPGGCGGGGAETSLTSSLCTSGGETVNGNRATVDALIALSNIEAADAVAVLTASNANPSAVTLIQSGISKNTEALNTNGSNARRDLMISALSDFQSAKALLGTGLDFVMGEGNLLF